MPINSILDSAGGRLLLSRTLDNLLVRVTVAAVEERSILLI